MTSKTSFSSAIRWAYTANWGERAFSALFTFILAALLDPRDFGTLAIAMVYISFLQLFLDQGFMAALIQKKHLEPEHLDAVFWMDVVLSIFLAVVSILVSGWWATKNHAPESARLISVLSLCIPIEGLAAVQAALLSRNMDFKTLSIRTNIAVALSGVVGIGLAFAGFRVWALVGQRLTRDLLALILLWKLSSWRPRFAFSWKHLRDLTSFSVGNFAAQLAGFGDTQSSSVFLGLLFGPLALGLYQLADKLVYSVVAVATTSIQAVSLPQFSRNQDQPEELRRSALACVRLSSTLTLPALSGMAAVSGSLLAVLGPKWRPASDALKVLCLVGMCAVFASFAGPMLQAASRPHQAAALAWIRVVVAATLLVIMGLFVRHKPVSWQLMGIALARFAAIALIVTPLFLRIMMKIAKIPLADLVSAVLPSAFASLGTVAAIILFQVSGLLAVSKPLVLLIAQTFVGGIVGLTLLLTFDRQLWRFVVSQWRKLFSPSLPAAEFETQ